MKIIQDVRIKGGKLDLKQRNSFLSDIQKLKDGDYLLTIEKKRVKRSLSQNAYYWGCIIPIVKDGLNDVGYKMTKEAVHEYLKGEFNVTEVINERTGEILKGVGSTSEMSTSQMMDYFAEISRWAAEYLNIQIPEPNEQLRIYV